MNRDELEERASDFVKGYQQGLDVGNAKLLTRENELFAAGYRAGLWSQHKYQWVKLLIVVIAGSCAGAFLGMGILYWIAQHV